MNQKGFVNIAIIIGTVVIAGIAGYFVLSQRTTTSLVPTPTPTPPTSTFTTPPTDSKSSPVPTAPSTLESPTTNVNNKTNSENLSKILEQLDGFPQQPCPTPSNRYHIERYVYVRTTAEEIPILHYPGTNVDTVRMMTEKVQKKMNTLLPNTLVNTFYYEVCQFAPNSGGDCQANNTIWCFNLAQ